MATNCVIIVLVLETLTQASQTHNICEALKAAGYNTMSTLLHNNNINQNNKVITIFAPGDEALDGVEVENMGHQMVPFKVDAKFFHNSGVVELPTLDKKRKLQVVTGQNEHNINNVRIVQWNAYNDGRVIVHGTQALFPYRGDH